MTLKKNIKKSFSSLNKYRELFHTSIKGVFLIMVFSFFGMYFLVSSGFDGESITQFLSPLYIGLVLSLSLYIVSLIQYISFIKIPVVASWLLSILCGSCVLIFLFPLI